MLGKKSILLVDRDDLRRETRIALLESRGAKVTARDNCSTSASLDSEGTFDLLIVVVNTGNSNEAAGYVEHVHLSNSNLPILLLQDHAVFVPSATSAQVLEAGDPRRLRFKVSGMLERSVFPDTAKHVSTGDWKSSPRPSRDDRPSQIGDD